ncbi:MAG: hypothetical protein LBD42_02910 [Desulfovibrio sp.]|nr:hypothetical protein [Desulfovibrio sp.]
MEIVDSHDRPLLCMPPEEALRQGLSVRMVAVALFSRQGRLIVHKRPDDPGFTGRWDIEAGFVLAGEAREDAALRLIASCMNLHGLSVTPLSGGDGYGRLSPLFSLFIVRLPSGLYPKYAAQDMMMVDADELTGLIRDVPELLSPELLKAATVPGLFYAR